MAEKPWFFVGSNGQRNSDHCASVLKLESRCLNKCRIGGTQLVAVLSFLEEKYMCADTWEKLRYGNISSVVPAHPDDAIEGGRQL
jgi:hypothetical protein